MAAVQPLAHPVAPHLRRRGSDPRGMPRVCRYWKAGRCNRNPCRFLHSDAPPIVAKQSNAWIRPSLVAKPNADAEGPRSSTKRQICGQAEEELTGSPPKRVRCGQETSAAWCVGDVFCGVAELKGHTKAVTGVALPEGSDKLLSGSLDGTVRVWDATTGQCVRVLPMEEGEIGCLIPMGPCVVLGVRGAVKAFHTGSCKEVLLRGPTSQVCTLLTEDDEHLFAGTEDGAIYVWRLNQERQCFEEVAMLRGHEKAVVSLAEGRLGLFSGSSDGSIWVWDLKTFRCINRFAGHDSSVTALLCWDQFLLSSSYDGAVKVWRRKPDHEEIELEVHYTHREDEGVACMGGTFDAQKKPVLLVSRCDGVVRVYDLPSLKDRGQICSKGPIGAISIRSSKDFVFTGDATGEIRVVKWRPSAAPEVERRSHSLHSDV